MGKVEIPDWLKCLPLAPEFRPTDTEFADPIAYISKIEKEASAFGICKIIPPLPKPSKRYVFANLNKSLLKCPELGSDINSFAVCNSLKTINGDSANDGEMRAVFTTRHQELGSEKRTKGTAQNQLSGVNKQVWQSGEIYTVEQFESKSKVFARSILGTVKDVSPLVIEAMFWKAASEKPIYIEYANDVPGSAFGESNGQFRYIHRRRRKSAYYKRSLDRTDFKKTEMDGLRESQTDKNKDASAHAETCLHASKSTTTLSTFPSIEALHSSGQKHSDASNEMEGTAGWKLSNSPWNLQVIARSLGSLTRFMPDDIPGVTSPMVYIGMLFSWFAWHVEDHELHSMNFLHTGSPKTWYAVPGDYALSFEEVIRSEAYGGNIDHLAALTLLGEKTTLLSPEVVVASGIPCCRLIQNPGEFVVTFPRAYHIGFSHGFNCGEAANFGTPQWLKVAKEAAVRRAVMNYLPMLSHQQLLYLLTMSFVSRVPRTLLPGVRSSRLRDRQREERELLVKKAFIEDILQENNLLSDLVEKNPNCRVVLWNADLLPDSSKDSQLPDLASTAGTSMADNMPKISSPDKSSSYLLDEMSLCMENLTDLYHGDDDLPSHFQTDSGALACVSCGILGFPFMTVIQPSEKPLMELQPVNHLVQNSSLDAPVSMQGSISGGLLSVSGLSSTKEVPKTSLLQFDRGWSTSCKSFRPRIFCLEHGLKIVKMLKCKGGVNLLVICHSDYQKIKAHARAVAEEIGSPFDYHEVPLEVASPEDLSLIDMAIDTEEHDDCEEDWTSKLGINLRYCVNARKNPQSKQAPYPLALGMLFPEKGPVSESLSLNWQSRKLRSKKLNHFARSKAHDSMQIKKDDQVEGRVDGSSAKKENLIQYSRRKFKSKETCFSVARVFHESDEKSKNVSSTLCGDLYNQQSKNQLGTQNTRSDCTVSCVSASTGTTQMQREIQVLEVATSISFNTAFSQPSNSFPDSAAMDENVVADVENQIVEESDIDGRNSLVTHDHFTMHNKMRASEMPSKENQISHDREYSSSLTIATDKKVEMQDTGNKCDSLDSLDEVHQELRSSIKGSNKEAASYSISLLNQPTPASIYGNSESPRKNYDAETAMSLEETDVLENNALNGSHKQYIPSYDKPINEHTSNNEACKATTELYTAADVHIAAAMDIEEQQETRIIECYNREIDLFTNISVKQLCVQIGDYAEGLKDEVILESEKQHQIQAKNKIDKEPAPSHGAKGENKNVIVPEVACSEVSIKTYPKGDLSSPQYVSDRKDQLEVQPRSINEEELCSGTETSLKESSASIQECSAVEKDACDGEDLIGAEVHSSKDNRESESCELTALVPRSNSGKKRRREVEQMIKDNSICYNFVRSPCEGLRPRARKVAMDGNENFTSNTVKEDLESKRVRRPSGGLPPSKNKKDDVKKSHKCDLDGCRMSFKTKAELLLHKRNRCPHEGCGKKFSSHKYALLHHRVHDDERPLKCPWKGCTMSFKWAWARTEHIRVHTGEKPYKCKVEGCGLSFRFISDYSRHRRKTGHYVNTST